MLNIKKPPPPGAPGSCEGERVVVRVLENSGDGAPGNYEKSNDGHGVTLARGGRATSIGPARPWPGSHRPGGVTLGAVSSIDDSTPPVRDEGRQVRDGGRRLAFAPSRLTIAAVLVVCVGALPLLLSVPYFWVVLLLPLAVIVWVVRVRTTVDADTVTIRSATGSRTLAWDDVRGLKLGKRSSVSAVLTDDSEVVLPAVHVRDLPVLAAASGGRIADPAGDV